MRMTDGLGRLLAQLAARAGAIPMVEEIRSTPWMSITFSGARHRLALRFDGQGAAAAADRLAENLDYAEFDLGRHILADIEVRERREAEGSVFIALEALTVSE